MHAVEEFNRYMGSEDTGSRKRGGIWWGETRQYCGQLGKQDNCQVAVSLSLDNVRFPQITSLAGTPRAQRHVADSIRTLRLHLSAALGRTLGHCPYCGTMNQK